MTLDDSVFDRLLRDRIVVLGQEVDDAVANRIVDQLLLLAAEDPATDITLYVNSPGGSVSAGMAVFDTMMFVEPDVATVATGMAASMGQFLLTAGTTGKRSVLPDARVLMHQPSSGVGGSESDITIQAQQLGLLKRQIAEITAERTGQPVLCLVAPLPGLAGSVPALCAALLLFGAVSGMLDVAVNSRPCCSA